MRRQTSSMARFWRDALGMAVEIGLVMGMVVIGLLIAIIATRGRFS